MTHDICNTRIINRRNAYLYHWNSHWKNYQAMNFNYSCSPVYSQYIFQKPHFIWLQFILNVFVNTNTNSTLLAYSPLVRIASYRKDYIFWHPFWIWDSYVKDWTRWKYQITHAHIPRTLTNNGVHYFSASIIKLFNHTLQ